MELSFNGHLPIAGTLLTWSLDTVPIESTINTTLPNTESFVV